GFTPVGGIDNFGNGFLPAKHQGTVFDVRKDQVENVTPAEGAVELQRDKLDFVLQSDRRLLAQAPFANEIESAIANQELAFRMQTAVPEVLDLREESQATLRLYAIDSKLPSTKLYGKQCLLARRLVERGVRFVQITMPVAPGSPVRWDQHDNIAGGHAQNALKVDQPIAGLLKDLKSRGMLEETLVLWSGEFGRTPFAQYSGRDHHPHGFSLWMAGGGVRGGMAYGATDEFGYRAIDNRMHIHDLHATILHLMGINHRRFTFRFGGRDFRLTDVYGNVAHDIIVT
ncbi:DUF1501 domain-containing protein, partial [Pirellulales bacterium]|nr:DUF1501 domain-containing protein [Pirellulales bacterium]